MFDRSRAARFAAARRRSLMRLVAPTIAVVGSAALSTVALQQPGHAQAASTQCSGYSVCPEVKYFSLLQNSADARRVDAALNTTEADALRRARQGDYKPQTASRLLGELEIYDKTLSVNRNVACASCHTNGAGFTGGISVLNRENVAFAGSVGARTSKRKPMSYGYAPFAPVLHYRASTHDFVGGNFWDMRATGLITGNPSGDQALDPPLTTTEMAMSDAACVIWRIYRGPYRGLFQQVWGAQSFAIAWPAATDRLCDTPLSNNSVNPQILDLSPADRQRVTKDYSEFGLSAAAFEAAPQISLFSSKFDAWQDGLASLTAQEQRGYQLFTGTANCSQCHSASGTHPLFTDFTAVNLGIPRNDDLPWLHEDRPDLFGLVANPAGPAFIDDGVGAFLASPMNTNPAWKALAPSFKGTFQVATVRNSAQQPYRPFSRAYMHNGYLKTLQDVVHFYNTRDVLPRCQGDPQIGQGGAGTTCWPAPEQAANENTTLVGNLGLSAADEAAIVAFLGSLTDGYPSSPTQ